jgi:hypothetical protein
MNPFAIIAGISTSVQLLKSAKEFFYPNKTIDEASAISSKQMAQDVGTLQEQLKAHREVIDRLVEQVKADKDMIEKHNEVLIQLGEAAQEALADAAKLRIIALCAIGISALACVGAILVAILK